jgi:hypothetical protein
MLTSNVSLHSQYKPVIEAQFNIIDKRSILVPFKLNELQQRLDGDVVGSQNSLACILKARQMGCSVYFLAIYIIECLLKKCDIVIFAHRDFAVKQIMLKLYSMIDHANFKINLNRRNRQGVVFGDTGSKISCTTANSPHTARASTLTHIHLSELAFYEQPETMMTATMNALIPGGKCIIETTANGFNYFKNFFYLHENMPAERKQWDTLFYPWFLFKAYSSPIVPEDFSLSSEEKEYYDSVLKSSGVSLSNGQMLWRRQSIDSIFSTNPIMFNQEYPYSAKSAFVSSAGTFFKDVERTYHVGWGSSTVCGKVCKVLESHPTRGWHYVFGADPSGGTGKDDSAIVGLCVETQEQVYEYNYNAITPVNFARYLAKVGEHFNHAYLVVEENSHGISVLDILKEEYPHTRIYKRAVDMSTTKLTRIPVQWGFQTQKQSLKYMIDTARRVLDEGVIFYSSNVESQLMIYSEDFNGEVVIGDEHQDIAMAFMLSCVGINHYRKRFVNDESEPVSPSAPVFDQKERKVSAKFFD